MISAATSVKAVVCPSGGSMNDPRSDLKNAFMFRAQPPSRSPKVGNPREKLAQNESIFPSAQTDAVKPPSGRRRIDNRHASQVLRGCV